MNTVDIWTYVMDPLLTHSQTLKERATQLLIKYKSWALVMQYMEKNKDKDKHDGE